MCSTQKESELSDNFSRSTYRLITKGGHALNVLISRLLQAADPDKEAWREEEPLKSVGQPPVNVY